MKRVSLLAHFIEKKGVLMRNKLDKSPNDSIATIMILWYNAIITITTILMISIN